MNFFFILGIIAGVILAVSITLLIMISIVKKSNDWGDYDGGAETVVTFEVLNKADKVKKSFSIFEHD